MGTQVSKRVFLVAAEPSGDLLGRELAAELNQLSSDIQLAAIGGNELASIGLNSPIDITPLSVVGLIEGLKAYPTVIKLADKAAEEIIAFKPDAVVLIDSWGFMLRVAQRLKKQVPDLHLIKLVGPQVWATRAGRAKTLSQTVDHLLAMLEIELPYYEPHGLITTVIGNPALGRTQQGDGLAFRQKFSIALDEQMLLVLPGSRAGEIKRVAPALIEAAQMIKEKIPNIKIVISPAASIQEDFKIQFPAICKIAQISDDPKDRYNAMAAANLALACSGTVTSELAIQGTPFLVGYKLGWITWAIARAFLFKPNYMSLLNIAADKEIAPEFLQTTLAPETIAECAMGLLSDPEALQKQAIAQSAVLEKMGAGKTPAARLAAEAILSDLNEEKP